MDEAIAELFNLVKKDKQITADVYAGDDIHMSSVSPYGISTGMAELDMYLGSRGGFPAAKIIEIFALPMSGKTTLALQAAAEWQKRGGLVVFIDTEMSYTPKRASELGCNPEKIMKIEVDTIEQIFETITRLLDHFESTKFDKPVLIIVDSTTAVPTTSDMEGDIDDNERPGYEAKQIKRGCKKVNSRISKLACKPTLIFINHSIAKIGGFGKKSDSGGGNGIKYFASVRIELTAIGGIKDDDKRIGQKVIVRIEKLKGAHLEYPSFTAELTNEIGFDRFESLKLAMIATEYASRPKGSQTMTILPNVEGQVEVRQKDFRQWVDESGGYDKVYLTWRKWAIQQGIMEPWGGIAA